MIRLKVNGANRQFDGDPEMPLLWFLRDELNLKGTKFGCGAYLRIREAIHKSAELTASNATQPAKSGPKASGAGTNRLSRKGGKK